MNHQMHKCSKCEYESVHKFNLKRHYAVKHAVHAQTQVLPTQNPLGQLNTNWYQFNQNQVDRNQYNIIAKELQNLKRDYITIEKERDQLVSNRNSVEQERLVQNSQQPFQPLQHGQMGYKRLSLDQNGGGPSINNQTLGEDDMETEYEGDDNDSDEETESEDSEIDSKSKKEDEDENVYVKCMGLFEKLEGYLNDIDELKDELSDTYEEIKDDEQKDKDDIFDCLKHYIKLKFKLMDVFEDNNDENEEDTDNEDDDEQQNENEEDYKEGVECSCFENFLNDFKDAFVDNLWANNMMEKLEKREEWDRECKQKSAEYNQDIAKEKLVDYDLDSDMQDEDSGEEEEHEADEESDLAEAIRNEVGAVNRQTQTPNVNNLYLTKNDQQNRYDLQSKQKGVLVDHLLLEEMKICQNVVDGLEKEGSDYFKHCPINEVEHVCKLCTHPNMNDKRLGKPFRKYNRSLKGSNMGVKRNILSKPQVGNGIFTLLATILPALISGLTGK